MSIVKNEDLFSIESAMYVCGCIMRKPSLLLETDKYILTVRDFPHRIFKIIFSCLYNMAHEGVTEIDPVSFITYLQRSEVQFEVFKSGNGEMLLNMIFENAATWNESNFETNYMWLKKLSTLRDLQESGFSISDFITEDALSRADSLEKLNQTTIPEIIQKVKNKLQIVENNNYKSQEVTGSAAAVGVRDLLEELRSTPEVGIPLEGHIFNYTTRGCRKGKMYMYSAPSGFGKALPNSVAIPLANGTYSTVGNIKPGDYLIDRRGKPTKVLQIFPQGRRKVFKVIFKDGREALCNDEHLWSYNTATQRSYNKLYTKTLREIIEEGSHNGYKTSDGAFKYLVPLNQPVDYAKQSLPIDPYVFGLLLGDGSFRMTYSNKTLQFSSSDIELVKSIASIQHWKIKSGSEHNFSYYFCDDKGENIDVDQILTQIPELINTYSYEKFIPDCYLISSIEDRWNLLAGLMDTDGSIDLKGRCHLTTTSERMAQNVVRLCRSLGLKTHITLDRREDKYTTGVCYIVLIQSAPEDKLKMFKLSRKLEKVENYLKSHSRFEKNTHNAIVNIIDMGYEEEMTCFLVDNEEHLFLMNDFIVTHNTRCMVGNACPIAFPKIEGSKIVSRPDLSKVLFIATEMQKDEIQTLLLSWISGVNEEHILLNTCTEEEKKLLAIAVNIMEQYQDNFIIEIVTDPGVAKLKRMITNYIIEQDVQYIFYDYIFTSPSLMAEFPSVREDVALMMLSNTLKELAAEYDVFIMTGSQLNGKKK